MGNKHSISPEFKDYQQQVSIQSKRPTREGSITDKPTPDYSKLEKARKLLHDIPSSELPPPVVKSYPKFVVNFDFDSLIAC